MSRADTLQERFDAIRQALAEVYGKELAFATTASAWLQAIEYLVQVGLKRVQQDPTVFEEVTEENRRYLQAFHRELCKYLDVNQEQVITKLSPSFREVLNDICGTKEQE